jgi:hypothetical protein
VNVECGGRVLMRSVLVPAVLMAGIILGHVIPAMIVRIVLPEPQG